MTSASNISTMSTTPMNSPDPTTDEETQQNMTCEARNVEMRTLPLHAIDRLKAIQNASRSGGDFIADRLIREFMAEYVYGVDYLVTLDQCPFDGEVTVHSDGTWECPICSTTHEVTR